MNNALNARQYVACTTEYASASDSQSIVEDVYLYGFIVNNKRRRQKLLSWKIAINALECAHCNLMIFDMYTKIRFLWIVRPLNYTKQQQTKRFVLKGSFPAHIFTRYSPVQLFTWILFNVFVAGIAFDVTTPNELAITVFFLLHNLKKMKKELFNKIQSDCCYAWKNFHNYLNSLVWPPLVYSI